MDGRRRATQDGASGSIVQPLAQGPGLAPEGTGGAPANILLKAGEVFVEGFRLVFNVDVDLGAQSEITFEATASADTYGIVYADVVITEISSADDPNIAVPQLGETTRREKLSITFKHSESNTSFNAAWSAIVALTPASTDRVWKGNVARIFICRYFRLNTGTTISNSDIVDFRSASGLELYAKRHSTHLSSNRQAQTNGSAWGGAGGPGGGRGGDGMIAWHAGDDRLILGSIDDDEIITANDAYRSGGVLVTPNPNQFLHHFQNTPAVARLKVGAGDTDGTPVIPTWASEGFVITSEVALGFMPIAGLTGLAPAPTEVENNFLATKNGEEDSLTGELQVELADAIPDPTSFSASGADPAALIVQKLVVAPVADFERNNPHSFIICQRFQNDLLWYTGQITRGRADRPVLDEFGNTPVPWDAVLAGLGSSHATGPDGIERAINFLRNDSSPNFIGTRNAINVRVRGLARWHMTRMLHQFGQASELSTQSGVEGDFNTFNNSFTLIGEGSQVCEIETLASDNASTTINGNINIVANRIEIKGFSFTQFTNAGTRDPRYILYLEANEVVLEDLHLPATGGIYIKANNITIRNCTFGTSGGGASGTHVISGAAGNPYVAHHLRLEHRQPSTAQMSRWEITHCKFDVRNEAGTHASVVLGGGTLGTSVQHTVEISHCVWQYEGTNATQPSIHFDITGGDVEIHHCRFVGAVGAKKAGADRNNTAPPFDGDYTGSPLDDVGGNGSLVANAYISIVDERLRSSQTHVHHNFFDVVPTPAGGKFSLWGAMIVMPTALNMGVTGVVANIDFSHNTVRMADDGQTQWAGVQTNPVVWGFYMAPSTPDGTTISNLVFEHITVSKNVFLLGGESNVATRIWRSIRNERIDAWPVAGAGYLTDRSVPIGIVLKNQTAGDGAASGRWCTGCLIEGNRITQSFPGGATQPSFGTLTLVDDDSDYYWGTLLILDLGHYPSGVQPSPLVGTDGSFGGTAGYFDGPRIIGNDFFRIFIAGGIQTALSDGGVDPLEEVPYTIIVAGTKDLAFVSNRVYGGSDTLDGLGLIQQDESFQDHYFGNNFKAAGGIAGSVVNNRGTVPVLTRISGNNLDYAGATPFGDAAMVEAYTGGAIGDNFQDTT